MVCFICDTKTHISQKQIGQMLIYLGQQQRLGSDEGICNEKDGIIVFFGKIHTCQKILEMVKIFMEKSNATFNNGFLHDNWDEWTNFLYNIV